MKRTLIFAFIVAFSAASLAFTSCIDKSKGNQMPADSLIADSALSRTPDSTAGTAAKADSSWDKAAESFAQTPAAKPDSAVSGKAKTDNKLQISKVTKGDPYRPQELTNGLNKAKNGDLRGAIADFDLCIAKNYKNYNAYFYKAKALTELNEPKNALPYLDLAIKNKPDNASYYYYRGKLHYEANNWEKAYADFNKAVSLKADFAEALNFRGVTQAVTGKHAEAIKDYDAAIKSSPDYAIAFYNKGTSEAAIEDYKNAVTSFSKCLDLDPQKPVSYLNRGNCYVMLKDYKSAISDYTLALALDPENPDAYFNRGAAYQYAGDKKACADWIKAQSLGNKKAPDMLKEYCK